MVINFFGEQFFKISFGDLTIALNPIAAKGGAKFGSDIVFISAHDELYNGVANATHGDRAPIVIDGPGEYEAKGLSIHGIGNETTIDGKKLHNTSYYFSLEDINILFLGAFRDVDHMEEIYKRTSDVDIVFLPLGDFLTPAQAYKLAVNLEAKIVIPMSVSGEKDKFLEALAKEGKGKEVVDKLTIKKKDLQGKNGDIIFIKQ